MHCLMNNPQVTHRSEAEQMAGRTADRSPDQPGGIGGRAGTRGAESCQGLRRRGDEIAEKPHHPDPLPQGGINKPYHTAKRNQYKNFREGAV